MLLNFIFREHLIKDQGVFAAQGALNEPLYFCDHKPWLMTMALMVTIKYMLLYLGRSMGLLIGLSIRLENTLCNTYP